MMNGLDYDDLISFQEYIICCFFACKHFELMLAGVYLIYRTSPRRLAKVKWGRRILRRGCGTGIQLQIILILRRARGFTL